MFYESPSSSGHTMKHTTILGYLLAIWLCCGINACSRDELEMVQIISLHGSMSPKHLYPADPNPATVWMEGLNDLTMLGKFQAYALGVFLRNFYGDFITSDPRELEAISSAEKGTVKSVQSLITALYSPTPYWEVVANFSWQPLYVKYDTDEGQYLSHRICPAADAEEKRILLTESTALLQTYQNLFYYWGIHSGMNLKSVADVEELYQILQAETTHNLTLPEWSKNNWSEMKYVHDIFNLLKAKSKKLQKLRGGPLLGQTIRKMQEKAMNPLDPRKVVVYSTHSAQTLGLLGSLGLGSIEELPPCATLLTELYKQEGEYFVRYLYLNSTMPQREPQEVYFITLPGCIEFCPLNYVIEYTRDTIPKNLDHECLLV